MQHPKLEVDARPDRDHNRFDEGWTASNVSESVKKDVFQLDSRIEGMEAALEEMADTMYTLQRKVRYRDRYVTEKGTSQRKVRHRERYVVNICLFNYNWPEYHLRLQCKESFEQLIG